MAEALSLANTYSLCPTILYGGLGLSFEIESERLMHDFTKPPSQARPTESGKNRLHLFASVYWGA